MIGILILSIKLLIHEKYEYQVISIDDYQFKEQMNNLGNSGWEAISARRVIDEYSKPSYEIIFKKVHLIKVSKIGR